MTDIFFHTNFPKDLITALQLLHGLEQQPGYRVERKSTVGQLNLDNTVLFIFDHAKKKVDLTTTALFESGYRVFAFKLPSATSLDPYSLSLTTLNLWSKILRTIQNEHQPFIYTYKYLGKELLRIQ